MGFSTLPNELRSMIFNNIYAKEDMKSVSLVCSNWHANMAPLMWYTLDTNLVSSKTRSLIAIFHPDSHVLPHVRRLITRDGEISTGEIRLRLLLKALPQDTLTHFKATSQQLSGSTIELLLQSQRKLKELDARIFYESGLMKHMPLASSRTWVRPLLKKLTGLCAHFDASKCSTAIAERRFRYYQNILECVPKLETLSILARTQVREPQLDLGRILESNPITPKFPHLTKLHLARVDLARSFTTLSSNMELSNLRTLSFLCCNQIGIFLDELLNHYATKGSGQLSDLTINDYSKDVPAVERFLKAGPKLTRLILDIASHKLVNKDCIIAHSSTLITFRLGTCEKRPPPCYPVDDIKAILVACQKLENISINLPKVHLDDIRGMGEDIQLGRNQNGVTHVETEFEAMLAAFAQHTPLKTLAMMNTPLVEYRTANNRFYDRPGTLGWHEEALCRVLYHRFATQVMQFMAKRGTAPSLFHSPVYPRDPYYWPGFIFSKGEICHTNGYKKTVAIPLKKYPRVNDGSQLQERDSFVLYPHSNYM